MGHHPHVLIIPSWYPEHKQDIKGSFFREQAIALHTAGCRIGVIHPQFRSLKDWKGIFCKPYGLHDEIDDGIRTLRWHSVFFTPKLHKFNRKIWIESGIKLFDRYVEKYGKPDIIHTHSLINAGYLTHAIQQKHNIPVVITEHSSAYARGMVSPNQIRELSHIVQESCDCLAVSNEFATLLNNIFPQKSWSCLPNMVHNDFLTTDLSTPSENFSFINICLLNNNKRIDILLKAFALLLKDVPDIILKIGGDGPERDSLENLAKELGITNHVSFLGVLNRLQVRETIKNSSAFVLSSENETFGVVLIEALALGKPVAATKCGGPESIVTPDVGYLVEKNSVEELKNGMLSIYRNRNQFTDKNIREYCKSNFSGEVIANKLIQIYKNAHNKQLNQ